MSDLAQLFKSFLYRDLAFILGGTIVISSLAYIFRNHFQLQVSDPKDLPSTILVLLAAFAYVVGYAVQDIGGILRVTSTATPFYPGRISCFLYQRFSRAEWRRVTYAIPSEAIAFEVRMSRMDIPQEARISLERILSLKVISVCIGGCSLLSAVALFLSLACDWSVVAAALGIGMALLSASLLCLGRIKGMQEMQFYQAIHEEGFPRKTGSSLVRERGPNK